MSDLLALISTDVVLKRKASTDGGEWAGACPFCGGEDRFRVWPNPARGKAHYWCRQCGKRGDAIQYLRDMHGLSFAEACERLGHPGKSRKIHAEPAPKHPEGCNPPEPEWQDRGRAFVAECQRDLWRNVGRRALAWLTDRRGLTVETIRAAGLGYNDADRHDTREAWGLDPGKRVWLPRGVVIPWEIGGDLWRVNIRRPTGQPKYIGPAGSGPGLYNADALTPGRPAMLLEGELDALTVNQEAGELVTPVATGSTGGARRTRWLARLALASTVLVAYDADRNGSGDKAAVYWLEVLPNAKRWRPLWQDANAMSQDGADLRAWVAAALPLPETEVTEPPVLIVWPADAQVATIAGKWKRRDDGQIEASYTRDELKLCLMAMGESGELVTYGELVH